MSNDLDELPSPREVDEPAQESGGADWLLWAIPLAIFVGMVLGTAALFLR